MHTKVCPSCGYCGRDVQNPACAEVEDSEPYTCPCCENDLYARPPLSYAEMEGFGPSTAPHTSPKPHAAVQRPSQGSTRSAPSRLAAAWAWVVRLFRPSARPRI